MTDRDGAGRVRGGGVGIGAMAVLAVAAACDGGAVAAEAATVEAQGAPVADVAGGGADEAVRANWRHPLGATLAVPEEWKSERSAGTSVFAPNGASRADGSATFACVFVFHPAPGLDRPDAPALVETIENEMRGLAATAARQGGVERLRAGDRPAAALRYDLAENGVPGRIEIRWALHDGLAIGLLMLGEREPFDRHVAQGRRLFDSLRFVAPLRDRDVVRSWSRGEAYTNSLSSFSMATETRLTLAADGRFAQSSQVAGGDASSSFDSGGDGSGGRWFAGESAFVLVGDDGSVASYRYSLVSGSLVLYDDANRRTIWN